MASITPASWQDVLKATVFSSVTHLYEDPDVSGSEDKSVENKRLSTMTWIHVLLEKQPDLEQMKAVLEDPAKFKVLCNKAVCAGIQKVAKNLLQKEKPIAQAYLTHQKYQELNKGKQTVADDMSSLQDDGFEVLGGSFSLSVDRVKLLEQWIEDPSPLAAEFDLDAPETQRPPTPPSTPEQAASKDASS